MLNSNLISQEDGRQHSNWTKAKFYFRLKKKKLKIEINIKISVLNRSSCLRKFFNKIVFRFVLLFFCLGTILKIYVIK